MSQMSQILKSRERPILFSTPMAKAIFANCKTQTRRAVKPQPPDSRDVKAMSGSGYSWLPPSGGFDYWRVAGPVWAVRKCWLPAEKNPADLNGVIKLRCPYGKVGDRLWIKTGYEIRYDPDRDETHWTAIHCWQTTHGRAHSKAGRPMKDGKRPGMFMPRWLSSESYPELEITEIRLEQLQTISESDARAEGFRVRECRPDNYDTPASHRSAFANLWDTLNAEKFPWDSDPWVWVISFAKLDL